MRHHSIRRLQVGFKHYNDRYSSRGGDNAVVICSPCSRISSKTAIEVMRRAVDLGGTNVGAHSDCAVNITSDLSLICMRDFRLILSHFDSLWVWLLLI